jgi:hypothetical protein
LIVIKTGVVLMLLAFSYLWALQPWGALQPEIGSRTTVAFRDAGSQASAQSWSWVRQFGTTSLLVYWVHIELVYGRWLGAMKEALTINETVVAAVAVTVLMLLLSLAKTSYPAWREKLLPTPQPSRNFGD